MAVSQAQQLHLVAHTSRILRTLEDKPDHPRKAEYAKSLRVYRGQWADMTPEEQRWASATLVADDEAEDLTPERVAAAVAALDAE